MPQTPSSGYVSTTNAGWVVYWVTFGLMAGSAVCFFAFTLMKPQRHRKHGCKYHLSRQLPALYACLPSFTWLILRADCTTLIVCIAAVAYYAMVGTFGDAHYPACSALPYALIPRVRLQASEGGNTYIYQIRGNDQRQIYWAHYVDWVFTTPLLLLDLLLMSACPVGTAV